MTASSPSAQTGAPRIDPVLLRRGVVLNLVILGLVFGFCTGLALFLATIASIALPGEEVSQYLGLLGVFMPGYAVSPAGAWIGFGWGFAYAAISGACAYLIYVRTSGLDLARSLAFDPAEPPAMFRLTLRLSGPALGLAIGALAAAQLFLSTAWLVVRGTAAESLHAALLNQYLPGYSVSLSGGAIGAAWLFVVAFGFAWLFALVYNVLIDLGVKRRARARKRSRNVLGVGGRGE